MGPKIFVVAGEASGDALGAGLVSELRGLDPSCRVLGLGGPRMAAAGAELDGDFAAHAAMGLLPVLRKLPTFLSILRSTTKRLREDPPDVLVPIDYPGFNLALAKRAKAIGIPVCYYVSPQIWAWRPGRIKRIARRIDHMMVLFDFETGIYERAGVPVTHVGHPLFDHLRMHRPPAGFRASLGLAPEDPLVGIFPGSRRQEVSRILPPILGVARIVGRERPDARFALPVAKAELRPLVDELVAREGADLPLRVLDGQAHDVMRAARAAVVASGTATLETCFFRTPMVIVYDLDRLKLAVARRLLTTPWVGMVNILASRELCPEFLRISAQVDEAASALCRLLRDGRARKKTLTKMEDMRRSLRVDGASRRAAETVLALARAPRTGA